MADSAHKSPNEVERIVFNYSYAVLAILLLLTTGATLAYHQNVFADDTGSDEQWTPVIFLIGLSISLLIFGMTYREARARVVLQQKTLDLEAAHKENESLLETEQTLRIAAEQANQAKDEFLGVVSHELKTPLHAIAGWSQVLKSRSISEQLRQTALNRIDRNLRIQNAIVEELLSFSDLMSTHTQFLVKKSVRMSAVFADAITAVSAAAFKKGLTLAADDRLTSEQVLGDAGRLKIAFVNVLSNAVKFTPAGGRVYARAFKSDGLIKLVVTDDGPGIPGEFLPHIFERYSQSEHTSTRHYGGLGLGLTIAEQIVKLHDGCIQAESDGVGTGSTFTIELPSVA